MAITLIESKAINDISLPLYDFLPGTPHPYANKDISFPGVANKLGLGQFWSGGSKRPAITILLEKTLEYKRGEFCNLILEIVRNGITYRNGKGNPITREEIVELNKLIQKVGFKIPDLWNPTFLDGLPTKTPKPKAPQQSTSINLNNLKQNLIELSSLQPQTRGYAYEKFLQSLFESFKLAPKSPFRLIGEQIDGSFEIETNTYLVEAKWQGNPISQDQLLIFREKVESKSTWSRGLFVSDSGFTIDGLLAFSRGRSTNIIGMTGQDIYFILEGTMSLVEAINRKARHAAETGEFYISVFNLSKQ